MQPFFPPTEHVYLFTLLCVLLCCVGGVFLAQWVYFAHLTSLVQAVDYLCCAHGFSDPDAFPEAAAPVEYCDMNVLHSPYRCAVFLLKPLSYIKTSLCSILSPKDLLQ